MGTRLVAGSAIPSAVADVLDGGPAIAVVPDADRPPADWRLDTEPLADRIGMVVGTSGSTGRSKGVQLTREAIVASARATEARLGGPGDWVCPLPLHYVAGLMTAARAHLAGGTLHVVAPDLSRLPVGGGRTYLSVVAAQLHRGLDDPATRAALQRFDAVLVGGSAVPAALLERGRAAGLPLVVTYGMAETCGGCVYDGRPLDGVEVDLDHAGRIRITGPQVFSGYRLDPAATAAALDGRTLLTQDRGRLTDGLLRVLGRLDDVVISGGVNVDLAQAQSVCDAVFGPERVVLLGVPDERWGERVVAVTTLPLAPEAVAERLADGLQRPALPKQVRRVAGLPRTATGKIDRQGLRRLWAEGS